MTRDENNRRIAEWLEPQPTEFVETPERCYGYNRLGSVEWRSPKGVWWYDEKHYMEWQPLDFYTDEAASAVLLDFLMDKALAELKLVPGHPTRFVSCTVWVKDDTHVYKIRPVLNRGTDRKTVVVEAALKFIAAETGR